MSLLALASQVNEAAIVYREAVDDVDVYWSDSAREHRDQASRALLEAVDALTGAVVEAFSWSPIPEEPPTPIVVDHENAPL